MVKENEFSGHRQQGSVPFLWEEKPGTPKKEWKSETTPANFIPSPAKLFVSVPFKWEEKPGKPLLQYPQTQLDSPLLPPPTPGPVFFPPPTHGKVGAMSQKRSNPFLSSDEDSNGGADGDDEDDEDEDEDDDDGLLELDLETFTFKGSNPSSAPALLANRLMTTTIISSAVPVHISSAHGSFSSRQSLAEGDHDQHGNWAFSASNVASNSSEYNSAGASVLEFLFPLFPPDLGFLNKVSRHEKDAAVALPELSVKDNIHCGNYSVVERKTRTLGELIQMSRRISCAKKKAVNIRRRHPSMWQEFMRTRAFACCIFGTSANKAASGLHKWWIA
ncbi:uncharacterized protein LOC131233572 [Magnolia sinica]|uniref:uncharacterized protein LOC131233572 n=1 Tax=Magnolia sinica TaxID=86752 RepID=UPI002659F789|nr:uncharacterized protein LOC131233572 [Magnolia sinica]